MTDFLDTRQKHSSYVDVIKTNRASNANDLLDAVHAIILNYDSTVKSNETKQTVDIDVVTMSNDNVNATIDNNVNATVATTNYNVNATVATTENNATKTTTNDNVTIDNNVNATAETTTNDNNTIKTTTNDDTTIDCNANTTTAVDNANVTISAAGDNVKATTATASKTDEIKQSKSILYLQDALSGNLDCVRTELKQKYGINMNFNDQLAIFSSPFSQRNRHEFLQQREANGLILDIGSHDIVCVPPRILSTMYSAQAVNEGLRNDIYRIYKVLDGTIVTIYWYEKWHIATYRGIYMENVIWHGKKTYREIFDNLLAEVGLTWDEFVGMFDKKLCYTYGFKHEEYHAFPDFKTRLWFVQSTVVDNSSKLLLFTSDVNPTEKYIPSQPLYDKRVSNVRTLTDMASRAETEFLEGKEPNYGYILRSKDPNKTCKYSDILIESQLMSTIRHCWYDNDDMNRDPDGIFVYANMICLTAVIKTETAKNFTKLFPAYVSQYNEVAKKINRLIDDICRVFTKMPLEINEKQTEIVHALVEYLTTSNDFMWNKTKLEENIKQISDLVKTSRHIPLIYRYIWPN